MPLANTNSVHLAIVGVLASMIACSDRDNRTVSPLTPSPAVASAPTPPVPAPSPPPNPVAYSVAGTVREVNGGPIAGVRVATNPPGGAATTDSVGAFSLENVTQSVLVFQKDGFRFTYWTKPTDFASNASGPLSIKMQPLFTLSVASGVSSVISADDLTYSLEHEDSFWEGKETYFCAPCKEIAVRPAFQGGARLRLRWIGSTPLDLWAGEYYSGASSHGAGAAGKSELVLDVPGRLDTVLVGVGPRNGAAQTLAATESFSLTIEP